MDSSTVLGTMIILRPLLIKVLGPTLDSLGEELKKLSENRMKNLKGIFSKIEKKLEKKKGELGCISFRILKGVFEEGSLINDELMAEYFSGLFVSASSKDLKDDRIIPFLRLVERLPIYMIRTHYLFYTFLRQCFLNTEKHISSEANLFRIFVPSDSYLKGMNFSEMGDDRMDRILGDCLTGLASESLIDDDYASGSKDYLTQRDFNVDSDGTIFTPTYLGVQLYLYVYGFNDVHPNDFCSSEVQIEPVEGIAISKGPRSTESFSKARSS